MKQPLTDALNILIPRFFRQPKMKALYVSIGEVLGRDPDHSPTLHRLLGLPAASALLERALVCNKITRSMMRTILDVQDAPFAPLHMMTASSRSADDADRATTTAASAFLQELVDHVEVTEESPLVFLRSAPGDAAWDIGMKCLVPVCTEEGKVEFQPLFILVEIETKSKFESSNSPTLYPREILGEQYRHMAGIMQSRNLHFLYVYADTGARGNGGAEDAVVLGRKSMEQLLGPMWPLYRTAHNLVALQKYRR
jgi:hypothetical protein